MMKFSESIYYFPSSWYNKILLSLGLYLIILLFFFLTRFPLFFSFALFLYYPLWEKEWKPGQVFYWFLLGTVVDSMGGYPVSHSFFYLLFIYGLNVLAYRYIFIDTWRAAVILGCISHIILFMLVYFVYPGTHFFTKQILLEFLLSQGLFLSLCLIAYPLLALHRKNHIP